MQLYHYFVALFFSSLSLLCLALPIKGADKTSIEYQAIEQISDPLDRVISFEKHTVKRPSSYSKSLILEADSMGGQKHRISHLNGHHNHNLGNSYSAKNGHLSKNKKLKKKKTEQELFDEFLATDALTGQIREKKKRSAFSDNEYSNQTKKKKQSSASSFPQPRGNIPSGPKFGDYFKEKLSSNKELYGAIQQGKGYFNEQKLKSVNVLKQYNIEFKNKEVRDTGILADAAKSRPKTEMRVDHSEIENSFLMRAINFATSWKGITLAAILTSIYILTSVLISRGR